MLILIHGEDIVSSRKKLTDLLATAPTAEVIRLQGTALSEETLKNALESTSLFADKRVVIIESLFSLKNPKAKDSILLYLSKAEYDASVIVWHEKAVDARTVSKYFAKAKVFSFPYPKLLFSFLDSIGAKSAQDTLTQFHRVLETQDAGLVYVMLLRQLRQMIVAKDLGIKGFPPTSTWQAGKLVKQSSRFSLDNLILLYRQLYMIDYKIKTGETPLAYKELIDIFLCTL